jgi:glucose/arabinose dehydrogenase
MTLQTHLARLGAVLLFGVTVAACAQPKLEPLRTSVVAQPLEHPWAMAFLPVGEPRGRLLVTERPGRMRVVLADGTLSAPLSGLPPVVAEGQGGLLDVVLHPRFEANRLVYWSYSEASADGETNSTAVARGTLDLAALALTDVKVIFRQSPKVDSSYHFGSRLVFARDGTLFIVLGDRFSRKDDAQTLDTHHGKVVRVTDNGGVPPDNPFVGRAGALPEIWSYGHRNLQGAALHPTTGALWVHEHGPQGGDELNVAVAGKNYGWPVITYGRQYVTGLSIGEGTERADVVPALTTWVPSIAPSGMAFVTSDRYPAWKGQLLVGALKAKVLVRLELDGERVVREHRHEVGARIRDVRQAPDGYIYLLTDEGKGRVLRVEPGG